MDGGGEGVTKSQSRVIQRGPRSVASHIIEGVMLIHSCKERGSNIHVGVTHRKQRSVRGHA